MKKITHVYKAVFVLFDLLYKDKSQISYQKIYIICCLPYSSYLRIIFLLILHFSQYPLRLQNHNLITWFFIGRIVWLYICYRYINNYHRLFTLPFCRTIMIWYKNLTNFLRQYGIYFQRFIVKRVLNKLLKTTEE